MASRTTTHRTQAARTQPEDAFAWITHGAFGLLLALVLARATFLEATTQTAAVGRGPGPASSLVLNLLCCVPAFLILLRRIIDPTYVLRWGWSLLPMALLAGWMALSAMWSADRFGAILGASHFLTAGAVIWSMLQLVRSWMRLRLVAAVMIGLLAACGIHGLYYKYYETPQLLRFIDEHTDEALRQQGIEPGTPFAEQFLAKVRRAEMLGFNASPNSFATVIVLLGVIAAGWIVQRWRQDRGDDKPPSSKQSSIDLAIPLVLATMLVGVAIIFWTDSKTAFATPVLAGLMLAGIGVAHRWLSEHARLAYGIGVAAVVLGAVAFIAIALARGGDLFHPSLTFRWNYWIGSSRIVAEHPLAGVGWANFPMHYLQVREPVASEEIKDPHNFLVRYVVELGLVGGVLLLAWMARLWWELTRPHTPPAPGADASKTAPRPTRSLAVIIALAFAISLIASVDFSTEFDYVLLEIMRRLMYFAALYVVAVAAAVISAYEPHADARPAPWILRGILVALAVFLVHNLVDFAMFEPGPMMLFALLTGAAMGARFGSIAGRRRHKWVTGMALASVFVLWLASAVLLVVPTVDAEELAAEADGLAVGQRYAEASQLMRSAFLAQPLNADYAWRASDMALRAGRTQEAADLLSDAIRANPRAAEYYQRRAEMELHSGDPDGSRIVADYRQALALNPHDVPMRLRFAQVLMELGMPEEALPQYEQALSSNDAREPGDPRREDLRVHLEYARALERVGRLDEAREHYRQALIASQKLSEKDPRRLSDQQRREIEAKVGS